MTSAVSALILVRDEAMNLPRCLDALWPVCSDVHVVDSGSIDGTVEMARNAGASVHFHPYTDHASQLRWALSDVPFAHDWLLLLDADNILTPALQVSVRAVLERDDTVHAAYYARYIQHFRGRPVRGLKSTNLTLMRRSHVEIDTSEFVDFRILVTGSTGRLAGDLLHDNAKEVSLDFWVDKHQRFAHRMAAEEVLRTAGVIRWNFIPRLIGSPDERVVWLKLRWYGLPLLVRPFLYFFYRYILRLGFLDGRNGLVFHFLHALWFRFLVDTWILELRRQIAHEDLTFEELHTRMRGVSS